MDEAVMFAIFFGMMTVCATWSMCSWTHWETRARKLQDDKDILINVIILQRRKLHERLHHLRKSQKGNRRQNRLIQRERRKIAYLLDTVTVDWRQMPQRYPGNFQVEIYKPWIDVFEAHRKYCEPGKAEIKLENRDWEKMVPVDGMPTLPGKEVAV